MFVVKHYQGDAHPTLKGYGFDGLVIGENREEAEEFVAWVNTRIAALESQNADLLAALESILGWANIRDSHSEQALQVRDMARAAIAKAKGE